jgi:hypothetical protein
VEVTYYIQRSDKPERFEEVDEYVFKNRKFAVLDETCCKPRYTDNYLIRDGAMYTVHLSSVTIALLSIVARILGFQQPSPGVRSDGWLEEPELVAFHRQRSKFYYRPASQETLVVRSVKKAA